MIGAVFTMTGGTIKGNTVSALSSYGGGVHVEGASFRIVNGTIYGSNEGANSNTAANGAALFVRDGSGTGGGTGTAQHGSLSGENNDWLSAGTLATTNNTINY